MATISSTNFAFQTKKNEKLSKNLFVGCKILMKNNIKNLMFPKNNCTTGIQSTITKIQKQKKFWKLIYFSDEEWL
jgi:hypothetical protein